jgi:hypothetical protein
MKVNLFFRNAAYAQIRDEERGIYKDIPLEPGRSSHEALRDYAVELKRKAERAIRDADIALEAASILENRK